MGRLGRTLLTAAAVLAAAGTALAEPVVLKAVTAWPKSTTEYRCFAIFLETVEEMVAKKAPGELKIQYIGGPEAVKTPDQVQAAQRGMVDMVFTANAFYVSVIPEVDALKLSDLTPMEERANGSWQYVNGLHEPKGLHYLGRLGLGGKFYIYLKKPIQTADLKGLNIRVSPMYLQIVKGLGGNPVVIPPTEVYQALERNVVDGFCWPEVGIRDWGWDKQVKYVIRPGFYEVPNPIVINLATWQKLSPKLKDLLTAAMIESEKKVVAFYEDLAKKELPILQKEGLQLVDLPAAEGQKLLKVGFDEGWKSVIEKSPKTGPELKKLLVKTK
ncbi:MAG: TRAP transporter substrate-binding protein DctP [Deltaproteobacteria bacterium]|nr:TRAP transporter substrate-binding protein DctP [Deltaproteobacteria bacterium]